MPALGRFGATDPRAGLPRYRTGSTAGDSETLASASGLGNGNYPVMGSLALSAQMPRTDNVQAYTAPLTADQYTARASLVRSSAANTADAVIRRQRLGIAVVMSKGQ